jgi:hypothetical protein
MTDSVNVRRQLDPGLLDPALHLARVQPHIHRPAARGTEACYGPEQSHVWDVDVYGGGDSVVRGVQYHESCDVSFMHLKWMVWC